MLVLTLVLNFGRIVERNARVEPWVEDLKSGRLKGLSTRDGTVQRTGRFQALEMYICLDGGLHGRPQSDIED